MQLLLKRILDFVLASAMLVVLSPLLLALALMVRLILGSPIFFRQVRPGFKGRLFVLFKFRTMTSNSDPSGRQLSDELRLTRFGRFLRRLSLDEIPQLLNVWRGEMSLVGPRPLLVEYLDRYTPEQARRHEVKPGITGWAQINGRNSLDWEERFKLDVWYVDHWTLYLDAQILLRTIRKVIFRENISQHGFATMQEFLGSQKNIPFTTGPS